MMSGNGFWYISLNKESSMLTAFATPFDCYRWLCMAIGISPAPEQFQRRLSQALEDLAGVKVIADNILVVGEGSHDRTRHRTYTLFCSYAGIRT